MRLAELYHELRMLEKACEVLKGASRAVGRPDAEILNRLAMYYDENGDYNRMESHYAEAAKHSGDWAGPLFNWALHLWKHRNFPPALEKIDEGILRQPDSGPYYILRARILENMNQHAAAKEAAREGLQHFDDVAHQTSWELGWYEEGSRILGLDEAVKQAKQARESNSSNTGASTGESDLPVIS
jgi:tetratricopeptide (TPR) repeat protein